MYKDEFYELDLSTVTPELINYWLAPWCKCICQEAPDGTMCKLCGHAHKGKDMTNTKETTMTML